MASLRGRQADVLTFLEAFSEILSACCMQADVFMRLFFSSAFADVSFLLPNFFKVPLSTFG